MAPIKCRITAPCCRCSSTIENPSDLHEHNLHLRVMLIFVFHHTKLNFFFTQKHNYLPENKSLGNSSMADDDDVAHSIAVSLDNRNNETLSFWKDLSRNTFATGINHEIIKTQFSLLEIL